MANDASGVEGRPDRHGRTGVTFPREWGPVPTDPRERRGWIIRNIRKGEERRARGERVDWLGPEQR